MLSFSYLFVNYFLLFAITTNVFYKKTKEKPIAWKYDLVSPFRVMTTQDLRIESKTTTRPNVY